MGEFPPSDANDFGDLEALGNLWREAHANRQHLDPTEPLDDGAAVETEPTSGPIRFRAPVRYRVQIEGIEGEVNG